MSGIKKYCSLGLLALLTTAYLTSSCTDNDFSGSVIDAKKQAFSENFIAAYGNINPNQDWGFGSAATRAFTRGMSNPTCPDISQPYSEAWVAEYLTTAKEPTSANVIDDYDNSYYQGGSVTVTVNPVLPNFSNGTISNDIMYSGATLASGADIAFYNDTWYPLLTEYNSSLTQLEYNGQAWVDTHNAAIDKFMQLYNATVSYAGEDGISNWLNITSMGTKGAYTVTDGTWVYDETYVLNFKITNTWEGYISVAANGQRTIVVGDGGMWYINDKSQTIGGDAKVIVANGGTINISKDLALTLVNQARLVVLPGGTITGEGDIIVTNGNAAGYENYNGGVIDIDGTFNNNFGKFYNYGKFDAAYYASGGSGEGEMTNGFYNHGVAVVGNGDERVCRNARIYNACQFYVKEDMQVYILEETQGASFIVDGELRFNGGEDGTNDPTYVALAAGALVKCGTLWNQGATWFGPTSGGYAVLTTGQVVYLNWDQNNTPIQWGYFANNLYIELKDGTNDPAGNGNHADNNNDEEHYPYRANYKVFQLLAVGNVTSITETTNDNDEQIPASTNFVKGVSGCTPGYKGKPGSDPSTDPDPSGDETTTEIYLKEAGRIFCEDLGNVSNKDMDYNDLVFDAWIYAKRTTDKDGNVTETHYRTFIQPLAAGGTLQVYIGNLNEYHSLFGVGSNTMVNTYIPYYSQVREELCVNQETLPNEIEIKGEFDEYYVREGGFCLKNIPIFVYFPSSNEATELTAIEGNAPQKYRATLGTKWAGERIEIGDAYTGFMNWVNNIVDPWTTGVEQNLFTLDSSITYDPTTAHGYTMADDGYVGTDGYTVTSSTNNGSSTTGGGSTTGEGTNNGGPDFGTPTGTMVYSSTTPTTLSNTGINVDSDELVGLNAATIYVYGTGNGNVYVNGVEATTVTDTNSAPMFSFTRGFGFTRSAETPVVKKCVLGPANITQNYRNALSITGGNFKLYQVSFDATQPTVTQPSGTVVFSGSKVMNWSNSQITIDGNKLGTINENTVIHVAGVAYDSWQTFTAVSSPWAKIGGENNNITYWTENYATGDVTASFEVSSSEAEALMAGGLTVQGYNFIVKYVTIDNSGVTPSGGGWSGTEALNWWPGKNIDASVFAGLANGDVVRLSGEGEKGLQVHIYKITDPNTHLNVGWSDFDGGGIEVNNEDYDNWKGYVEFTVSESNIDEITNYGINVRGTKFTLKSISIIKKQ